jgi:predicted membrane-bound spermidine synthase
MGPYLLGLGLGSASGDQIREELRLKYLWGLEWASALFLPLIPLIQLVGIFLFINLVPPGINLEGKLALWFLLGMTSLLALISGLLGGAQLPLILKFEKKLPQEWILAINYMGPLLAGLAIVNMNSLAVPVSVQIYAIGLVQMLGLLFLVNLFEKALKSLALLFIPLIVLVIGANIYPRAETLTIKSSYMGTKASLSEILQPKQLINVIDRYGSFERVRTPYQTIDFFVEPASFEFSVPSNASVYLNRKPQFDLYSVDVYHETMVYAALNLLKQKPKSVLILGAGDGLLLKEFKKIDGIDEITMVELDEGMIEWSKTNYLVSELNDGVLSRPEKNVKLIVGDGVSYLRDNLHKKFDLILIDFPFPNGHDLAKLYSFEFYKLVIRSLAQNGIVVVDLPLYFDESNRLSKESRVIVKTMRASGFKEPILFGPSASFIGLSTSEDQLSFDYSKFPKDLHLASYLNFMTPFGKADLKESEINTMFWPKGL